MTDLPNIDKHILMALDAKYGRTPLEVMSRCPRGISYNAIRKRLAELALDEVIDSKEIVDAPGHAVREYRAWK